GAREPRESRIFAERERYPTGKLEAFHQCDAPSTTLDAGRRFIVVVPASSMTNVVCLNVGIEMRVSLIVDFDPITADVAPGTSWHPYHVLSAFCNACCLGCSLEIEIQLSRLARLCLRVQDRRLYRAIHKQCYPVYARLQSL